MESIYVHAGESINHTPGSNVAAGQVVVQGELVGVAPVAIAANTLGSLTVSGVFDFAKATGAGTAIAAGALTYWDDTNNRATTSAASGANKLLGKCVLAAADGDARVRIRLSQ